MSHLIENLRSFDRKERFAVLREALGFDPEKPRLNCGFKRNLSECIDVELPQRAFLAMDYHLDWIDMALHLAAEKTIGPRPPFPNESFPRINENQQDIDLLVAFESGGNGQRTTHLVLIEAKAYLYWDNNQLRKKARRLRAIFCEDGRRWDFATPHFVLMTGKRSAGIRTRSWPKWMKNGDKAIWLDYDLTRRLRITRCTETGRPLKDGGHLRID